MIALMEGDDVFMLLKGIIHGNTDIIEDEDMHEYDGTEVIATFLNVPPGKKQPVVDWDSYVMPSTRGEHVDEYMKAMRENDRL